MRITLTIILLLLLTSCVRENVDIDDLNNQCWCYGYSDSTDNLYNHIGTIPQGVFPGSNKIQPLIIGTRSNSVILTKFAVSERSQQQQSPSASFTSLNNR